MKIKSKLPIFTVKLPVTKVDVKIRPYTIKEEKILLLAKDATGPDFFVSAMVQIVDNCTLDMKSSSENLPMADLIYLFIQTRAKSVGEISELQFTCKKETLEFLEDGSSYKTTCNGVIQYELNLNDLDIANLKETDTITIDPEIGLGIKLKPVSVNSITQSKNEDDTDSQIKLIYDLMICLFDSDTVETKDDISFDEFKEFIETLPSSQLKLIIEYIDQSPYLTKTIMLKCPKCGNETEYTLKGVNDFF
jgi:hypothetical protein